MSRRTRHETHSLRTYSSPRVSRPAAVLAADATGAKPPLGLPPVPIPADNPQTPEKIALGEKLFDDKRFSSTGEVACATCHDAKKAFTDSPLADLGGHQGASSPARATRPPS